METQQIDRALKSVFELISETNTYINKQAPWVLKKNNIKRMNVVLFIALNIIRASSLKGSKLINLTIYEFDDNQNFVRRIEAESANISSLKWKLNNIKIIDNEGKYLSDNIDSIFYISMYDIKKIKSLYSNLDTISFWKLEGEIKLLEQRGYSTKEIEKLLEIFGRHKDLSLLLKS